MPAGILVCKSLTDRDKSKGGADAIGNFSSPAEIVDLHRGLVVNLESIKFVQGDTIW